MNRKMERAQSVRETKELAVYAMHTCKRLEGIPITSADVKRARYTLSSSTHIKRKHINETRQDGLESTFNK